MSAPARAGGAALLLCALAACEAGSSPEFAATASPRGTYLVRLYGHPDRPLFFEHRIRAEVLRDGRMHVPPRMIHAGGPFDRPFGARFDAPRWTADTVLRFPSRKRGGPEPDTLTVRNRAAHAVRAIRVETGFDMFLILDLPPGGAVTEVMTSEGRAGQPTWFDVVVDRNDADLLMRGHGTFGGRAGGATRRAFDITVSEHGVAVALP